MFTITSNPFAEMTQGLSVQPHIEEVRPVVQNSFDNQYHQPTYKHKESSSSGWWTAILVILLLLSGVGLFMWWYSNHQEKKEEERKRLEEEQKKKELIDTGSL